MFEIQEHYLPILVVPPCAYRKFCKESGTQLIQLLTLRELPRELMATYMISQIGFDPKGSKVLETMDKPRSYITSRIQNGFKEAW